MASSMDVLDVEMEVVLEDTGCLDMEVDLPLEQRMITELQACRNSLKVALPTATQDKFLGLPVESSRVNYSDFLYIVLDTNVLLSHLKFLQELKDQSIKGIGKPVLIVPWVVIQELDSLKDSTRKVSDQACKAGKFINQCLSASHPRVRGQTVDEVNTEVNNLAIDNNDDRILHCCLVYRHKIKVKDERGAVILFSNDNMLCAKAKMNDIIACDRMNLLAELKKLSEMNHMVPVSYTHTTEYSQNVSRQLEEENRHHLTEDCLCEAESHAREALAVTVHYEMKRIYGELCNDVMVRKPPWSFADLIVMLDKHWVAVFRYMFNRPSTDRVKYLLNHTKNRSGMLPRPPKVLAFIGNVLYLLEQLRSHSVLWPNINVFVASLKVLKQKIEGPNLPPSPPTTPTYNYQTTPTHILPTPPSYNQPTPSYIHTSQPLLNVMPPSATGSFQLQPSPNLLQLLGQCPAVPIDQLGWLLQVIRESVICGIFSVQSSLANGSFTRQTEVWLIDFLRSLEGLLVTVENILTQGVYVPTLRSFFDAVLAYLAGMVSTACPLTFTQLCDVCQLQGTVAIFQEALGFLSDGRLQLLHLLQQTIHTVLH